MRRFPRNAQSRADALAGPGHVHQHYIRNALGRKAEDARYTQADVGTVAVAAGGTANAANESDIVAGGQVLTLTLSGPDRFVNPDAFAALVAAAPTTDTINTGFDATSISADAKVITITLVAIAGYDIAADAHYDVTIPAQYFVNRNSNLTVTGAINVTAGA